ncbi:MAG: hypothetical protein JXK05_05595 [Campylobacterales bacterium]|nr:hypothetical protein [Campylobacterales bacterium]
MNHSLQVNASVLELVRLRFDAFAYGAVALMLLWQSACGEETLFKVQGVHEEMTAQRPWLHSASALRGGLFLEEPSACKRQTVAMAGGHLHLITENYRGFELSAILYAMASSDPIEEAMSYLMEPDRQAYVQLSEAALGYRHDGFRVLIGRQTFDTPFIDSDDWVMMPNAFSAVSLWAHTGEQWRWRAGYVHDSAGSGNGVATQRFIPVAETFAASGDRGGALYAGVRYGVHEESMSSLWAYRFVDIADLLYAEHKARFDVAGLEGSVAIQASTFGSSGKALAHAQEGSVVGGALRMGLGAALSVHAALNRSFEHGAFGYIGGSPYLTSMEVVAIDAVEGEALAYNTAVVWASELAQGWSAEALLGYGRFAGVATKAQIDEIDLMVSLGHQEAWDVMAVAARVEDAAEDAASYHARMVMNYHFWAQ